MSSLGIKLRSAPRVSGTVHKVAQGEPGGYYVPALAEDGKLAWTPSAAGMPAVEAMEIPTGVSSWNDLQGKPFGEEKVVIEWDGVIGDKAFVTVGEEGGVIAKYVKVAPAISKEELVGATITKFGEGIEVNAGQINDINIQEYNGILMVNQILMVVPAPYSDGSITIPEAGVYFYCVTSDTEAEAAMYVSKLEKTTVRQLDPKFVSSLEVTITMASDGTITSSHTGEEINTAALNGASIVAKCVAPGADGEMELPLVYNGCAQYVDGSDISFYAVLTMFAYSNTLTSVFLLVDPTGTTVIQKQFTWG